MGKYCQDYLFEGLVIKNTKDFQECLRLERLEYDTTKKKRWLEKAENWLNSVKQNPKDYPEGYDEKWFSYRNRELGKTILLIEFNFSDTSTFQHILINGNQFDKLHAKKWFEFIKLHREKYFLYYDQQWFKDREADLCKYFVN